MYAQQLYRVYDVLKFTRVQYRRRSTTVIIYARIMHYGYSMISKGASGKLMKNTAAGVESGLQRVNYSVW